MPFFRPALFAAVFTTGCIANPTAGVDDDPDGSVSVESVVPDGAAEALDPTLGDDAAGSQPPSPESMAPAPASDAPATDPPDSSPPCTPEPFVVDHPESVTRVGDALYIALEDGRVLRAPLGETRVYWPPDVPALAGIHDDRGLARLLPVAPDLYVRRVQRGDVGRVEFLDVTADGGLALRSSTVVPGTTDAMAVADGRVFLCSGEATVSVGPDEPVVSPSGGDACAAADAHVGGGRYLGRIRHGRGNLVPSYAVFEMSASGARGLMDHGFNPGGNHQYGDVVALFLGQRRGLVDVQNTHNYFGLDLTGETGGHIYDTLLSLAPGATLISTARDLAWVATEGQIRTFDLETPAALTEGPHGWPDHVDAALRDERHEVPRVLFADDEVAVFRGADGLLAVWGLHDGAAWRFEVEACP